MQTRTTGETEQVVDQRRNQRRDELISAAVEAFRSHGSNGVGVAEICTAAGVGKGVFSHHFPGGKNELVAAVIERNTAEIEQLLTRLLDTQPLADAVMAMFDFYARRLAVDSDYGCPVAASLIDSSADSPAVRSAACNAFEKWAGLLAEQLERDGASTTDARTRAVQVIAAFEGTIIVARATNDPAMMSTIGGRVAADLAR